MPQQPLRTIHDSLSDKLLYPGNISHIIFDLGDVLFTWSTPSTSLPSCINAHIFKDMLRSQVWHEYEKGNLCPEQLYGLLSDKFNTPPHVIKDALDHARLSLRSDPAMVQTLHQLRAKGHKLFAMSNISAFDFEYLQKNIHMEWSLFDDIFISQLREKRTDWMREEILNDKNAYRDVSRIHDSLSGPAPLPGTHAETQFRDSLAKNRWISLLYVCNDLMVFPVEGMEEQGSIHVKEVTKKGLATTLVTWRTGKVLQKDNFLWPFFIPTDSRDPPNVSWAESPESDQETPSEYSVTDTDACHNLSSNTRNDLLKFLSAQMNHHSAYAIGNIHRKLQQPLEKGLTGLGKILKRDNTWNALAYVCVDLNCFPSGLAKVDKSHLIAQLLLWRSKQPTEELQWTGVDYKEVLQRLQQAISEVTTPTWVTKPQAPPNVGRKKAGTLKADHWRTIFVIHLPLALLSLWGVGSPLAVEGSKEMASVLETSLWLSCALITMTKDTLTSERRESFRNAYLQHVLGLRTNFPRFFKPTHHLAFRMISWKNLALYGTGQFEKTILHAFNNGASVRQWLLRPDCPPLLKYCLDLLDKAYHYRNKGHPTDTENEQQATRDEISLDSTGDDFNEVDTGVDVSNIVEGQSFEALKWLIPGGPSQELVSACGTRNIRCFTRARAPRGFYTVPNEKAMGNSFVAFRDGDLWSPGQIQHIFDYFDGKMCMAIRRNLLLESNAKGKHRQPSLPDPFTSFWSHGFEARMVSSDFNPKLEIVKIEQTLGHVARWNLGRGKVVVLSLSRD
ncbi:hypothetical protein D9758_013986 [Tetrapyrgos nigripes]|uniref:Uncharacterized protein n=1 Tax=Tetrapyrgos nigripes TaxID=182062 RepID=A0A8H5G805_9AGAR|nr:hypothetical protein D9758_013986 [Tetrapyrgos nigripes]